jgi:tetratricopeptide (TPR) repeat protein
MGELLTVTGKPAEALASHEQALMIRQKLADAHPGIIQLQSELARSCVELGYMLQLAGKSAEALASYEQALMIRQKLADANPNITESQYQLARSHDLIGYVYRRTGKPIEALAAYERAIAMQQKLADAHPSVIAFQRILRLCLGAVGAIHLDAGRPAEAAASLRRAAAILERITPMLEPRDRYNLACVHAQLAAIAAMPGSGMTAADGRTEADRAMHWVHLTVATGYRNVALMQKDHDLDPLRSRDDFQRLMMDLSMPDDPFAPGR